MKPAFHGNLRVFADHASLSQAAAEFFVSCARRAVTARGRFVVALSGGQTPVELYRLLASGAGGDAPWQETFVLWSDERYVPQDAAGSNYHMARTTLLDFVAIPKGQVFPMPTDLPQAALAAQRYEATLEAVCPGGRPCIDLLVLGLGADGHCASLFPQSAALGEKARLVVASLAPVEPQQRITLTYPALNAADTVLYLVSGAEKAEALMRVFSSETTVETCPAIGVQPRGELIWYIDQAAASQLPEQRSSHDLRADL